MVVASYVGTAAGAGSRPPGGPPGGVWTCAYIAAHPAEAAAALVSCDARGPVTVPGVTPAVTSSVNAAATPCARVPASGDVSQGVFAWMQSYPYFNYFSYSPSVTQLFTYYVQKQNGQNVQSGQDTQTNSHPVSVGANYYRLGAQNNAPVFQHWVFCWSLN
jgi:hypothetical protein